MLTLPHIKLLVPFDGHLDHRTSLVRLLRLDWIGVILTTGFVTCLGIGLQWGGVSKDWNDIGVIIVSCACAPMFLLTSIQTLALAGGLFVTVIVWSLIMGARAMIPMSLLRSRHFSAGIWVSFFGGLSS